MPRRTPSGTRHHLADQDLRAGGCRTPAHHRARPAGDAGDLPARRRGRAVGGQVPGGDEGRGAVRTGAAWVPAPAARFSGVLRWHFVDHRSTTVPVDATLRLRFTADELLVRLAALGLALGLGFGFSLASGALATGGALALGLGFGLASGALATGGALALGLGFGLASGALATGGALALGLGFSLASGALATGGALALGLGFSLASGALATGGALALGLGFGLASGALATGGASGPVASACGLQRTLELELGCALEALQPGF